MANFNTILDYILTETIKRKNEHSTNSFKGTEYKATRIIPVKEIAEKFQIEEYEVEIMYFELTNNSYINGMTGNVTLKGLEFADTGGFTGKRRRETTSIILQSTQTWAIAIGTSGLLIFEVFKYFYENTCC